MNPDLVETQDLQLVEAPPQQLQLVQEEGEGDGSPKRARMTGTSSAAPGTAASGTVALPGE